jgi:aromatic ring-opening dioxygenase catalytic subunit (LigB family)
MPIDWGPLEEALAAIPAELDATPRAVLVITAHWEATSFTVQGNPKPPMIYDYGGFPPETYQIQYPAPGDPTVADRVIELLRDAGLPHDRDDARGFDHGTFVPMYVMYPEASVPIVQMSILGSFDPELHLAAGRALAPLRDEGVLIVASGLPSFHDLSSMGAAGEEPSRLFDQWLTETMVELDGEDRSARLTDWTSGPMARAAHPREDHLIPLLVAVGAAEDERGHRNYHEAASLGGHITSSAYRLGSPVATEAA